MTVALLQKAKSYIPKTSDHVPLSGIPEAKLKSEKLTVQPLKAGPYELVIFCPQCRALETLSFDSGSLVEKRKFSQNDGYIYHDCGSNRPCRVYRVN